MGESESGDVFDVKKVRKLVEMMKEHDLSEVDLKQSGQRIRIRRGPEPMLAAGPAMFAPQAAAPPPAAPPGPVEKADPANIAIIKSPMVGTFYTSANPESPPYVQVGDSVGPDSIVCIVEAMKVFNEIPAECSGKIIAALASNGDAVSYDQPLFKVDTGG